MQQHAITDTFLFSPEYLGFEDEPVDGQFMRFLSYRRQLLHAHHNAEASDPHLVKAINLTDMRLAQIVVTIGGQPYDA